MASSLPSFLFGLLFLEPRVYRKQSLYLPRQYYQKCTLQCFKHEMRLSAPRFPALKRGMEEKVCSFATEARNVKGKKGSTQMFWLSLCLFLIIYLEGLSKI